MLSPACFGDVWILRQCPSMLLIHSSCSPAAHCPHAVPQHTPYCKVPALVFPTILGAKRYLAILFSIYYNTAKSPWAEVLCSPKWMCFAMQIILPFCGEIQCYILVYILYICTHSL